MGYQNTYIYKIHIWHKSSSTVDIFCGLKGLGFTVQTKLSCAYIYICIYTCIYTCIYVCMYIHMVQKYIYGTKVAQQSRFPEVRRAQDSQQRLK